MATAQPSSHIARQRGIRTLWKRDAQRRRRRTRCHLRHHLGAGSAALSTWTARQITLTYEFRRRICRVSDTPLKVEYRPIAGAKILAGQVFSDICRRFVRPAIALGGNLQPCARRADFACILLARAPSRIRGDASQCLYLERHHIHDRLCGPSTGPAYPSRDL